MSTSKAASPDSRVCPWWMIYTFDNPVRRLFHKPEEILDGFVRPGDRCLDLGCGIGFFTIPMARIVGPAGSVTAADLQPEMLAGVKRRAQKYGLSDRVMLHQVEPAGLNLADASFDFALAFWMVHEVPEPRATLSQIAAALKPGGRFLLVEPKGHVTGPEFSRTVEIATAAGFTRTAEPDVTFSRVVLFTRE